MPPHVLQVVDNEQEGWNWEQWQHAIASHDVIVATPDLLKITLITYKYLDIEKVGVMVFDECHHATGLHAMATILLDGVHPFYRRLGNNSFPRLLGLTAAFIKGSLQNPEKQRQEMEANFYGKMICPTVKETRPQTIKQTRISYGTDGHHTAEHEGLITTLLDEALHAIGNIKDIRQVINDCKRVFIELGRDALLYHVEHGIVRQIDRKIAHLLGLDEKGTKAKAMSMSERLPMLCETVAKLKMTLTGSGVLQEEAPLAETLPSRTPKLESLLTLLQDRFSKHHASWGYRGIIYVAELSLVPTLANQINANLPDIQCGVITGARGQSLSEKRENIDGFCSGKYRILVATSALEDGYDNQDCQFAILYTKCKTAKSHIQMTGRVRHEFAEHIYFENDPDAEVQRAARIVSVAKDTTLTLSDQQRKDMNESITTIVPNKYPYPFTSDARAKGGIVNVYNCKDIFIEYCKAVLGQQMLRPPEELYDIRDGSLISIRYPSPGGWKSVSEDDDAEFWSDVSNHSLFPFQRAQKLSATQKRERRLVYIVTVRLRQTGLLNENNRPSKEALEQSKKYCQCRSTQPAALIVLKPRAKYDGDKIAEDLPEVEENLLSRAPKLLLGYAQFVLGSQINLTDDLFDYSTRPLMPTQLWYPTRTGWMISTFDHYEVMFKDMSLGDQLESESGRPCRLQEREKVEMGIAYVALLRLQELEHLDEDFHPCLTTDAVTESRQKCNMHRHDRPPSVIDMSIVVTQSEPASEMSHTPVLYGTESMMDAPTDMDLAVDHENDIRPCAYDSIAREEINTNSLFDDATGSFDQFGDADCDMSL